MRAFCPPSRERVCVLSLSDREKKEQKKETTCSSLRSFAPAPQHPNRRRPHKLTDAFSCQQHDETCSRTQRYTFHEQGRATHLPRVECPSLCLSLVRSKDGPTSGQPRRIAGMDQNNACRPISSAQTRAGYPEWTGVPSMAMDTNALGVLGWFRQVCGANPNSRRFFPRQKKTTRLPKKNDAKF